MTKPTEDEMKDALAAHFSALGKSGGTARAKKLTPARRKAIAKKAAKARWPKTK
jgi:hypothetical protein